MFYALYVEQHKSRPTVCKTNLHTGTHILIIRTHHALSQLARLRHSSSSLAVAIETYALENCWNDL